MIVAKPAPERHLGMAPGELDGKPYAQYWHPDMAPLADQAREAVAVGPVAPELLPTLAAAPQLIESALPQLENGYALTSDGALHIAIATAMPDVVPAMVDWWFGWHSDEPQRYKLWHPRAHVHARWETSSPLPASGRDRYVGYVSCVDEYVGGKLGSYRIHFVRPERLGFDVHRLVDPRQATAVCARVGFANVPFDIGYLAHYVQRTSSGSVMRSRFWVGGPYAAPRRGGLLSGLAVRAMRRFMRPDASVASALLVHCSQEMSHLATFLPALHAQLSAAA
jgi:hypothetical protein